MSHVVISGKCYRTLLGTVCLVVAHASRSIYVVKSWNDDHGCWSDEGHIIGDFLVNEVDPPSAKP